jgi:hypothetical protein
MVVQNFDVWVIVEEKAIALVLQNGRSAIKEGTRLPGIMTLMEMRSL